MNLRLTVRALLVRADGKILVIRRSPDDENEPGRVDFPGGGVEPGESYVTSIVREIEEEAGALVPENSLKLAYAFTVYDKKSDTVIIRLLYVTHVVSDHVRLSHEHDAYWWHEFDEVKRLFADISWSEAIAFVEEHGLLEQ